jgi:hypothetical protein
MMMRNLARSHFEAVDAFAVDALAGAAAVTSFGAAAALPVAAHIDAISHAMTARLRGRVQ